LILVGKLHKKLELLPKAFLIGSKFLEIRLHVPKPKEFVRSDV